MIQRFWILAAVALCLALSPAARGAVPVDDLLRQAFYMEAGERKLEAAIAMYKEILGTPGVDHLTLFEARLRMGTCYEKLGQYADAVAIYEQAVKETSAPLSRLGQEVEANVLRLKARAPSQSRRPGALRTGPIGLYLSPSGPSIIFSCPGIVLA